MTESLFGHLALQFSAHPENLAVEALGYVLQRSEAARAGMAAVLALAGVGGPRLGYGVLWV